MKITYIANARIPTEKANGIQIMKMCDAFASLNIDIKLIVPFRFLQNKELRGVDPYEYYNLKHRFPVSKFINLDLYPLEVIGFPGYLAYIIQELSFGILAAILTIGEKMVYTRSKTVAVLRGFLHRRVYFESHDSPNNNFINRTLARNSFKIITITRTMENAWKKLGAITQYAPDGVGEEFFINIDRSKAREKLNLSQNEKIALYAGNFYIWKGVKTLFETVKITPKVHFYLVGWGDLDSSIETSIQETTKLKNIQLSGHRPYNEIPIWLRAADILILPNSAKFHKGSEDTSPLKLFEYMASGTPIISSRVSAITEIVFKKEVTFFMPDNPESLSAALNWVINNPKESLHKAKLAKKIATKYTWEKRAKNILKDIA